MRRAYTERRFPVLKRERLDNERMALLLAFVLGEASNVVDVGAHTGTFLADAVRLAPAGRHFAFEALPDLAARVTQGFPGVEVHAAAVGAEAGNASFVRNLSVLATSGLVDRMPDTDTVKERITVPVVALDDVIPADLPVHVLKVDVEGGELGVFQGAERLLRQHQPTVVFEHGLGGADHYGTTPEAVHDLLRGVGLRIFDLDGNGPISAARFREEFDRNSRWNWVAHR